VPGIGLVRTYNRNWLKADLVAGVTVFAILVPSCLAYGELAGFEPVIGLYAALVAMIAYALFGSSRQLIVGPDATIAILIALIVAPLALGDSARYAALAAALTILIGLCRRFLIKTHSHRLYNSNRPDSDSQPVRQDFWHRNCQR